LYYRVHGSLFIVIVVTDVTLTLYYRVHGSLFNMIVVTDVTLTLYYRVHGSLFNKITSHGHDSTKFKVTSVTTIILNNELWTR
jgi:hypothetical protein